MNGLVVCLFPNLFSPTYLLLPHSQRSSPRLREEELLPSVEAGKNSSYKGERELFLLLSKALLCLSKVLLCLSKVLLCSERKECFPRLRIGSIWEEGVRECREKLLSKALGRLVRVGSTCHHASTPRLSTRYSA